MIDFGMSVFEVMGVVAISATALLAIGGLIWAGIESD